MLLQFGDRPYGDSSELAGRRASSSARDTAEVSLSRATTDGEGTEPGCCFATARLNGGRKPSHDDARPAYGLEMHISIEPLRLEDARAVLEAEDEQTVRWLSEEKSTIEGTTEYIAQLARDAEQGKPKRVFGVWLDGRCVGTVDFDPDVTDGLESGDVNIAYGVAPWVRGRGIAARAVELICATIHERAIGTRAVIRTDTRNVASSRVAEKAGFVHLRDVHITTETLDDGTPVVMHVYGRGLI